MELYNTTYRLMVLTLPWSYCRRTPGQSQGSGRRWGGSAWQPRWTSWRTRRNCDGQMSQGFPGRLIISYSHLFKFLYTVRLILSEFFVTWVFVLGTPWMSGMRVSDTDSAQTCRFLASKFNSCDNVPVCQRQKEYNTSHMQTHLHAHILAG